MAEEIKCSECSRRKFYQIGYADGFKDGGINKWTPCNEKMPKEKEQARIIYDPFTFAEADTEHYMESELVLVTVKDYDHNEFFTSDDCTINGKWVNFDCDPYEVIAWKPLPEPYNPSETK